MVTIIIIKFFRYDYDDPQFDNIRLLTNTAISGDGPVSLMNFFPKSVVKLIQLFVSMMKLFYRGNEERRRSRSRCLSTHLYKDQQFSLTSHRSIREAHSAYFDHIN